MSDRLRATVRRLPGLIARSYRELWLLAISAVVGLALLSAQDAIDHVSASRIAACVAQNQRHDRTIAQLDRELHHYELGASRARRAQLQASRASTVALIDQLDPVQNCIAVVRRPRG